MFSKSVKIKILKRFFKKFKIDPVIFAYNNIGILNWENDDLSGETFFINTILSDKIKGHSKPVLFDVGANVGRYSASLLKAFKNADVHAFEPLPACLTKLEELKKEFTDRMFINGVCVSDNEDSFSITTYSNDLESEHASIYSDVLTTIHKSNKVVSIPVLATTIDKYCEEQKIENIDLLKIDTEGHEFKALLGAKRMLEENRISVIQFEFNEMNVISRTFFRDFYNLLNDNYDLFRLNTNSLVPIKQYDSFLEIFKFQNFIAINKNRLLR